jgi:hypothetical protein
VEWILNKLLKIAKIWNGLIKISKSAKMRNDPAKISKSAKMWTDAVASRPGEPVMAPVDSGAGRPQPHTGRTLSVRRAALGNLSLVVVQTFNPSTNTDVSVKFTIECHLILPQDQLCPWYLYEAELGGRR